MSASRALLPGSGSEPYSVPFRLVRSDPVTGSGDGPDVDLNLPFGESDLPRTYGQLAAWFGVPGRSLLRAALARLPFELGERLRRGGLSPRELLESPPRPVADADPDVVVVGAGLAGICTALTLTRRGLAVRVLEAGLRVGGRVLSVEGLDLGAAWLHSAFDNPLTPVVSRLGLRSWHDAEPRWMLGGRGDPELQGERLQECIDRLVRRLDLDVDLSAADVLLGAGHVDPWALGLVGPLSMGVEIDQVSTRDFAIMAPEEGDAIVEGGMDGVAEALAAGLDVRTDHAVHWIERPDRLGPVRVHVGGDRPHVVSARAVVVTVSTGVLASGSIRFTPSLKPTKRKALADLPMGRLEKHVFELEDARALAMPPGTHVHVRDRNAAAVEFFVRPAEADALVAVVGGAAVDVWTPPRTLALFERAAGVKLRPTRILQTGWSRHPRFLGAYSTARPGRHSARHALAAPEPPLFFAGEATETEWAATAAGAYRSGLRAARQVVRHLTSQRVPGVY